jgi:N-acetylglucosaminyldiphosphoundecaprenol N-acetyl-beta-D-mannosaminyltransferase
MEKITILGVTIDPVKSSELNLVVLNAVRNNQKIIIANHNLHSVYLFHKNAEMRSFYALADIIHCDGMPLVFWAKILGLKIERIHRVSYLDWIDSLLEMADRENMKIFILGGKEAVTAEAVSRIKIKYSNLRIKYHHGFFTTQGRENEKVIDEINEFKSNLLFIAMGMPRQESWILKNHQAIHCNVIFQAGACFDYIAEAVYSPPRWAGRIGVEWLFRLFTSPQRVLKRYLWEPWALIPYFIADLTKKKKLR